MTTLDDLELELRKLPGVRATGFTERDDVLLVQIHVGEEETEPGLPLQATRIAYRYSDRPVAVELVRWRTRGATHGHAPAVGQPQQSAPAAPAPGQTAAPPAAPATPQPAPAAEAAQPAPSASAPSQPPTAPIEPATAPATAEPEPSPPPPPAKEPAAPAPSILDEPVSPPPPPPAPPAGQPPGEPAAAPTSEAAGPLPAAPDQAGPAAPHPGVEPPPAESAGAPAAAHEMPREMVERRSETGDEDRVRLLAVLTFPDTDELEVHLTLAARRTIGRAAASRGLLAAVEATLDALRGFVPGLAYEPAWARTLETSTGEGFLVAAGLTGTQTQTPRHGLASGASAIEAAARATLQALNRSIVFELATIRAASGG